MLARLAMRSCLLGLAIVLGVLACQSSGGEGMANDGGAGNGGHPAGGSSAGGAGGAPSDAASDAPPMVVCFGHVCAAGELCCVGCGNQSGVCSVACPGYACP